MFEDSIEHWIDIIAFAGLGIGVTLLYRLYRLRPGEGRSEMAQMRR